MAIADPLYAPGLAYLALKEVWPALRTTTLVHLLVHLLGQLSNPNGAKPRVGSEDVRDANYTAVVRRSYGLP